jgi:tetratricopeptide (TPR) repeat protein
MCARWVRLWIYGCGGAVLLLSLALSETPALSATPAVREAMLRATDRLLDLDPDGAAVECRALLALPEGEAPGKFCLSLVSLTRAEDLDDPAPEIDRFLGQVEEAIAAAAARERTHPDEAEVKLLLGLAYGGKALAEGSRKNYLASLQAVREAQRRFAEALQLDPGLVDAYYGIGLYDYALSRLPTLVKPLVGIVLPKGDATQGLQEIERVADRGLYLRTTAQMALLRLYAGEEEKYPEALRYGRELLARYPGNPDVYFATAHVASELGHHREALDIARRVGRQMEAGRPHFGPDLTARYDQLLGKVYMDHGEYATAVTFFDRATQVPTPPRYRWVTAWAWTRSGMVFDLQGNRDEAERRYRKALAVGSDGAARDLARRYLDTPYRGRVQGKNRPPS